MIFTTTLLATLLPADAQDKQAALLDHGRLVAEQRCGKCHATGDKGTSPHKITPPFRDLSVRFPIEMLEQALSTGTISGHDEMPMFDLEPDDMRALIAHIDRYAPVTMRYLKAEPPK
jgi:mono/diheme cytochrome c family protein